MIPYLTAATTEQFSEALRGICEALLDTTPVHPRKWQSLDVTESPVHATHELPQMTFYYDMPQTRKEAVEAIEPDLPWAEGHFKERVSGVPVNPGEWHDKWPYHVGREALHQNGGKYDHNYMERMWPAWLHYEDTQLPFTGYRFRVGDLDDVVKMLDRDSTTRQAYLPIWFPEDTGATAGQRVPCTLGYHFLIRDGVLNLSYYLRSCEIRRHFTNDVYMACRLAQWMGNRLGGGLEMGTLHMAIASMHGFVGDTEWMEERCEN